MFQLFMLDQVDLDHIDSKQIPAFLRIDRDVKIQRMILREMAENYKGYDFPKFMDNIREQQRLSLEETQETFEQKHLAVLHVLEAED